MKTFIYLFILIIVSLSFEMTKAELVKGYAKIRDVETKQYVMTLKDSTYIKCNSAKDGWHLLSIEVFLIPSAIVYNYIDNSEHIKSVTIKSGAILRDVSGKEIGKALKDFEAADYQKGDNSISAFIESIEIENKNIYRNTDADLNIADIISKGNLNLSAFSNFIADSKFEVSEESVDTTEFNDKVLWGCIHLGPPDIRMILVFDSNKLFCILDVYQLKLKNVKSTNKVREFRVSYYSTNKSRIKDFESIYFPLILTGA